MAGAQRKEFPIPYASLLRHHIHTGDHVFYPMAQKTLTAEEMDLVGQEFAAQKEKSGGDTFERCHKTVVDMGSILTYLK
jgi:hemerythrin-like domain-containing protein